MPTNFPGSLDSFTTKVDNVDTVYAADVNNLQLAVASLEKGGEVPQSITYAASITPDASLGALVLVGVLTGNITINAPTNTASGRKLHFIFTQDGTGSRTVTWNAVFKVTNWTINTAANAVTEATFTYDGSNWFLASNPALGGVTPIIVGAPTGVVATDWANIVAAQAKATAMLAAGGKPELWFQSCPWNGSTLTAYALGNHTIVPQAGVSYLGIPPLNLTKAAGAGPGDDFSFTGGTVFLGDGTAPAIAANITAAGAPIANWQQQCLENVNIYGFGFDNFTYGIQIGAQNVLGLANSQVDQVYARNCSVWGFEFENFAVTQFGVMFACLSNGGIHLGVDMPGATYFPGNSFFGHLFVAIPQDGRDARKCRGVYIQVNANSGVPAINELLFDRLQVNAFNVPQLSVTGTFTNASANITVPDGTKFAVGMLVQIPSGANNFGSQWNWVVLSVAGNVITLGRNRTGAANIAGGNDSQTITSYGYASLDVGPSVGGATNWYASDIAFNQVDVEGSKVGVFIENAFTFFMATFNVPSVTGVVARNCSYGQFFLLGNPSVDFDGNSATTCTVQGVIGSRTNNNSPPGLYYDSVISKWVMTGAGAANGQGVLIGSGATDLLGFWGATPIARRAGAAQAAVATTGSTSTTPFGFTTAAQADAIVTLVNELRAAMVAAGFIKGSA